MPVWKPGLASEVSVSVRHLTSVLTRSGGGGWQNPCLSSSRSEILKIEIKAVRNFTFWVNPSYSTDGDAFVVHCSMWFSLGSKSSRLVDFLYSFRGFRLFPPTPVELWIRGYFFGNTQIQPQSCPMCIEIFAEFLKKQDLAWHTHPNPPAQKLE